VKRTIEEKLDNLYPVRKPRPLGRLGCNIYTFFQESAGWVKAPALSNGVYKVYQHKNNKSQLDTA